MNKAIKPKLVSSNKGINYYIIKNDTSESNRIYGIYAEMENDKSDCMSAENLFFTEAEAEEYCKMLAANEVYPITLCDVLSNIFFM